MYIFRLICISMLLLGVNQACAEIKVLAFAGSTREDSANKKLVKEAARLAKEEGATVTIIDLKDYPMPFYDADLEIVQGMPETAKAFRNMIIASNVVLIASPEYNHSFPGVLKNALDWASRTEDGNRAKGPFKNITFAIMSASPGKGGGAKGLPHLHEVLKDIGGTVIEKQVSVPNAYEAFDSNGSLISDDLTKALQEEVKEALAKSQTN